MMWPLLVYFVFVVILVAAVIAVSYLLGQRHSEPATGEPYEGGIKKDKATMSYYFVTTGLALGVLILFTILVDVFKARRSIQLLIDNGQNPMIAYAGINNFIIPVLALTGVGTLVDRMVVTPWLGFLKGLIITLLLALCVSLCTRKKIFWRT